jgi:hypothetical protein
MSGTENPTPRISIVVDLDLDAPSPVSCCRGAFGGLRIAFSAVGVAVTEEPGVVNNPNRFADNNQSILLCAVDPNRKTAKADHRSAGGGSP